MDYVKLALTGIVKLTEMIAAWRSASAEEQSRIYQRTERLVNGLDEEFDESDKRDDSNTERARRATSEEPTRP